MSINTNQPVVRSEASKKHRKLAAFGLAGVVLVAGIAGAVATSGAYFTDKVVTSGNTLTAATIKLGATGDTATTGSLVTATNILPIASADVTTKAVSTTINIRNTGTAAFDWDAALTGIAITSSGAPVDALAQIKVRISTDGGVTWGADTTLAALKTLSDGGTSQITSPSSLLPAVSPALSINAVKVLMWLDSATGNTYQGVAVTFGLTARAIQAGTALNTSGVVFP